MSVVLSYLEVARLLLVQESELDRRGREGANTAAEAVHVDERREYRHSFHPITIGDARWIGFEVTDNWRREGRVAVA